MFSIGNYGFDGVAETVFAYSVPQMGLYPVIGRVGGETEQMFVDSTEIAVYGEVVVVEHNQKIGLACPGIVKSLISQSACECAVADYRNHLFVRPLKTGGSGQSEGGGNGSGRMAHTEGIID